MRTEYDFSKAKRGAIAPSHPNKERVTIRLDQSILQWFREKVNSSGGGNYQTMINSALLEYIEHHTGKSLERSLRRIIREELQRTLPS
jgi:uncharacterized protein (DUF4415 family)